MRRLHFGCGRNLLPAPWENHDRDVNIAQPLPFEAGCAAYVCAEHVIEHVPFVDGMGFLRECWRVLEPGGVLRFAFPDVTRFVNTADVDAYLGFLSSRNRRAQGIGDVFRYIMLASGHRSCWTRDVGTAAAFAVGFAQVHAPNYGASFCSPALRDIDGHHKSSPVAILETTVLEAKK